MREGWWQVRLGDVCGPVKRAVPSTDFHYVDIASVSRESKTIMVTDLTRAELAPGRARQQLETGDVLVSTVRPNLNAVATVPAELDASVGSTGFSVLRAGPEVLPEYLFAVVRSHVFIKAMTELATGSNYPAVTDKIVRDYSITLPPVAEQRRIVDLIAAVDNAIEAAEGEAAAATATVRSLLDRFFPLNCDEEQVRLDQVVSVTDCEHKTAPATTDTPYAYSVGTAAVRDGFLVLSAAKPVNRVTYEEWTERRAPVAGDIILTREAPAGEVALLAADDPKICLGQRTVLLRASASMPPEYIWLALQAPRIQGWIASRSMGQTVKRINVSAIRSIPIPLSDPDMQETIVKSTRSAMNARIAARTHAESLRTLRSNLLTVLLSGEHGIPESYDHLLDLTEEGAAA